MKLCIKSHVQHLLKNKNVKTFLKYYNRKFFSPQKKHQLSEKLSRSYSKDLNLALSETVKGKYKQKTECKLIMKPVQITA